MKRAGDRVSKRKLRKGKVGQRQRITKDESIAWFEKTWNEDFAKVLDHQKIEISIHNNM